MKSILSLCIVCLAVTFAGCETTDSIASPAVSPGAISETDSAPACCTKSNANLGAVSDTTPTTCSKSNASLGAVSEKAPTCNKASTCSKSGASLGAVSDKPSHCSGSGPCPYAGSKTDG